MKTRNAKVYIKLHYVYNAQEITAKPLVLKT